MANWSNATVTNKGYALQAKLLSTDKLVITRVVSGSGRVIAGQLVNQTAVSDIQQTLSVEALSYDKNNNAIIKVSLNNENLSASYVCNQIGIYANDPDEGEILYMIAQEADKGEEIPSITEQPNGFYCGWMFSLTFSNSSNISVTIDPANALSKEAADMIYVQEANAFTQDKADEIYLKKSATFMRKLSLSGKNYEYINAVDEDGNNLDNVTLWIPNTAATDDTPAFDGKIVVGDINDIKKQIQIGFSNGIGTIDNSNGITVLAMLNSFLLHNGDDSPSYQFDVAEISDVAGRYCLSSGKGLDVGMLQTVLGRYNDASAVTKKGLSSLTSSVGSLFVIGNGTSAEDVSNAFRVTVGGASYAGTASNATGADKAKYREWLDGNPDNEDRRGFFVTLDGKKIRKATSSDKYVFGVVSAPDIASFIDNTASECWNEKYVKDVFGSYVYEEKVIPAYTDEKGNKYPEETVSVRKINPAWNPDEEYIPREERKEWSVICEKGDIVIRDDGTCQVNGYCRPNDEGIGTASETQTPFYVMERKDENHVLIYAD